MNAYYSNDYIFCPCGTSFYAHLETCLSNQLWDDSYETELSDEETYTCPTCKMQYNLEITVEKEVVTSYRKLNALGQFIRTDDNREISLSLLQGAWIGELIQVKGEFDEEAIVFPDGVYVVGEKEYTMQDGIVVDYWSIPDENQLQLSLLEECYV